MTFVAQYANVLASSPFHVAAHSSWLHVAVATERRLMAPLLEQPEGSSCLLACWL
jgi:hypothetical protein